MYRRSRGRADRLLRWIFFVAAAIGSACACGGTSAGKQPSRSPSLDYAPSQAQTSNGETLGADRMVIGDKLQTGPRVGTGVIPADQPPKREPKQPPSPTPASSPPAK